MTRKKKPKPRRKKGHNLKMEFVSMSSLDGSTVDEKIDAILEKVKDGKIVIINEALSANEEAHLVTATMEGIREDFSGVEFCSLETKSSQAYSAISKLIETVTGKKLSKPGLTFIGPAEIIREIQRDPDAFYVSAKI